MKNFRAIILGLLLCASASICLAAGTGDRNERRRMKEEHAAHVAEALASRTFKLEMDLASPMSGGNINLSSGYSLEVAGDTVSAYLPFYGRAYNVPYGEGGGISFDEEMIESYRSERKGKAEEISLRVRARGDSFSFHITVFSDGNASVSVNSNNRAPMSYRGEMVFEDGKKR